MLGLSGCAGRAGGRVARLKLALLLACSVGCASAPPAQRMRADAYFAVLAGFPDVQGRRIDVSAWQGRVVVIQFITTWCFPCIATVPRLQILESRYGAQGLSVVAVGMDIDGAKVLAPFQEMLQLRVPLLVGDAALRDGKTAFGRITTLPTTVIVGRDGTVLAAYKGAPEQGGLESFVEDALRAK